MENSTEKYAGKQLEYVNFSTIDYCLFAGVLLTSVLIGVYFGFYKKQKTADDYLMGGRNMGVFPIAVSLAASYVSALTVLGMPAEIYSYGTQYSTSCLAVFIVSFVIAKIYLPVFYESKISSTFEYLSLRYDNRVRLLATVLSVVSLFFAIPVIMLGPSLAFSTVSGIEMKYTNPVVGLVCIFYTAVGGFRAVVWNDTIQFIIMMGGILAIIVVGIPLEGGLSRIWNAAERSGRIEFFDFDVSMQKRTTFWSMMLSMSVQWINTMGVNQICVQRFLSVPTMNDAKKVLYIYCIFVTLIKALCLFTGLIMFARYSGCDPLAAGFIKKTDQILPYYILDVGKGVPGLSGVFIAGIFSASLSTMSTLLNTLGAILYNDFIKIWLPCELSGRAANVVMRLLVVGAGVACISLVFVIEKIGNLVEMTHTFIGLTVGAMLGIYTLGMLCIWVNTKSVLIGSVASFLCALWIFIGNKTMKQSGIVFYTAKSFSLDECDPNLKISNDSYAVETITPDDQLDDVPAFYRISFMWYSLIGSVIMIVVSLAVAQVTQPPDAKNFKIEYFSPMVRGRIAKYFEEEAPSERMQEMKLMGEEGN